MSAAGGEFSADELAEGATASDVERGDGVKGGKKSAICRFLSDENTGKKKN